MHSETDLWRQEMTPSQIQQLKQLWKELEDISDKNGFVLIPKVKYDNILMTIYNQNERIKELIKQRDNWRQKAVKK